MNFNLAGFIKIIFTLGQQLIEAYGSKKVAAVSVVLRRFGMAAFRASATVDGADIDWDDKAAVAEFVRENIPDYVPIDERLENQKAGSSETS